MSYELSNEERRAERILTEITRHVTNDIITDSAILNLQDEYPQGPCTAVATAVITGKGTILRDEWWAAANTHPGHRQWSRATIACRLTNGESSRAIRNEIETVLANTERGYITWQYRSPGAHTEAIINGRVQAVNNRNDYKGAPRIKILAITPAGFMENA